MKLFNKISKTLIEQEEDQAAIERQVTDRVGEMWEWLRRTLDAGCEYYLKNGDPSKLQDCLTGNAYKEVIAYLDQLRANNIIWEFPQRDLNAQTKIKIEGIQEDRSHYIITEYIKDYSKLDFFQHDQIVDSRQAHGEERILRATIQTTPDDKYYISEVVMRSE